MGARELTRKDQLMEIMRSCKVCHLAMIDTEGNPYVLPFNFGIDEHYIWFHAAPEGKKLDALKMKPTVCVSFSSDYEFGHRHEQVACSYFMKYKSVLAFGEVEFIEDQDEKIKAMNIIMKQYTGKDDFTYNSPAIKNVCMFRLPLSHLTGRTYGY